MPRAAQRSSKPKSAKAKSAKRSAASPQLAQYRKKRDFAKTPEPHGARAVKGDIFVVQKHAATRLHYDFRLALDGTLKSWAVTRGPSLNPDDRRLAVHVEDHPMDYARFEGIIPKGQYGGGTVMVWDFGTWQPIGDAHAGYRKGHLEFVLSGKKMMGRWHLVRMKGRRSGDTHDNWLLIKGKDEAARDDGESILAKDRSVLSGRAMDAIAAPARGKPAVWQSNRAAHKELRTTDIRTEAQKLRSAPATRGTAPLPDFVPPQLATLVDAPPKTGPWIHEVKLDGYRLYARIADGACALLTRRGLDWTDTFPALARTLSRTRHTAALDGEVVFFDPKGVSDFGGLQDALSRGRTDEVALFAFDLLHLDGHDLRGLPLVERKARLKAFLDDAGYDPRGRPAVVYSEHFPTDGRRFLESACRMALEGIMSKRADAPYRSGRSADWVKSKCRQRQEFVIGGFTDRTNAPRHIGALLLGYYDDDKLAYAGKVGTGMDTATQRSGHQDLAARRIDRWPFSERPPERAGVTWVRPEVVCEVEFHGWTRDGRIRQGSFQGLRLDKKPTEVVREQPAHTPDIVAGNSEATPMATRRRKVVARARGRGGTSAANVDAADPLPAGLPNLTHPDRVLLPEQGLTKRQIVDYYVAVADHMLPHVVDRPLTLIRCTQGQDRCFYQKHPVKGMSPSIRRVAIREKNKTEDYIAVDDLRGVVELVQFGSLELNPWGATTKHIETPDRIIFDLDPDPSVTWDGLIAAMQDVRQALDTVGLVGYPKTTGGKGLHVTVPIEPRHAWPVVKEFARTFAEYLARRSPERYTTNMSKAARKGRIFIDYLRNDRGSTAVAPYSTRARKGGAIAVPISWREVNAKLDPSAFTADAVVARLKKLRVDPWDGFFDVRQRIDELSPPAVESTSSTRRRVDARDSSRARRARAMIEIRKKSS